MAVYEDDAMRRRFALADMGKFNVSPNTPKGKAPRRGSDPVPTKPYHPMLNSEVRMADTTVIGSDKNATLAPFSQKERTLASAGRVPPKYANTGTGDFDVPQYPVGAPVMLPREKQSAFARFVNPAPAPAQATAPSLAATALNANPAPGIGGMKERDEAKMAFNRPTNAPSGIAGADANVPASLRPNAPAPTQPDVNTRISDERRMLLSDYENVMRQLTSLGSAGRDDPLTASRRQALIAARKGMESRLRDMAMATPRTNVVQPADARASRERLAAQTGVDTRTPTERAYSAAATAVGPLRGMGGPGGAGDAMTRDLSMAQETRMFNERQTARDARVAEGQRRLTTAPAGGEAPLDQFERLRRADLARSIDEGTYQSAVRQRAIRDVNEGTPEEQLTRAQAGEASARAQYARDMTDIERQRMTREYDNPNSATNRQRAAEDAERNRASAQSISGINPAQVEKDADTTLRLIPTSVGTTTDPTLYATSVDQFINTVLLPLEELAQAGDAPSARRIAAAIVGNPAFTPRRSLTDRLANAALSVNPLMPSGADPKQTIGDLFNGRGAALPDAITPHAKRLSDAMARLQRLAQAGSIQAR